MPAPAAPNPLRDLPFFSGLPDTLLWHLGKATGRRQLAKGDLLFKEGDEREVFAVIVSGAVMIEQHLDGATVELGALGKGEVIGEGILLEENHHATSARATEPTELMQFKKESLLKLLKEQPTLYAALLSRAARTTNERIKRANAALVGATADAARIRAQVREWIANVSVLVPAIGCETAIKVAREAVDSGKAINDLVVEKKLLTRAQVDQLQTRDQRPETRA